ncbi:MAG: RNA polymerase sigma factor [Pseudomonadota bacterium]
MTSHRLMQALHEHEPRILGVLARRLGCDDAARDVYQMLSEHLISSTPREVHNPEAYVFRAAANMASSYQRSTTTRKSYESVAAAEVEQVSEADPSRSAEAAEAIAIIEQALDELPILTKSMFLNFRIDGMRQQDIAAKYGVSLSTVEKRIAAATLHCHRRLRSSADGSAPAKRTSRRYSNKHKD